MHVNFIPYSTPNLGSQRIVVKTLRNLDHPSSVNSCLIVYSNVISTLETKSSENQYAIPKINILRNLSCLETRFRLLAVDNSLHSSLNLAFRQYKLHSIFFGMAYDLAERGAPGMMCAVEWEALSTLGEIRGLSGVH